MNDGSVVEVLYNNPHEKHLVVHDDNDNSSHHYREFSSGSLSSSPPENDLPHTMDYLTTPTVAFPRSNSEGSHVVAYAPETLIAYEFLEPGTHLWRWELATVEQQVSVRTMYVDMWLRKGEDGTYHTATDNIIQQGGGKGRNNNSNSNEEEDKNNGEDIKGWGTALLEHADGLLPVVTPRTEEGRLLRQLLQEKQSSIRERLATASFNVERLTASAEIIRREQQEIEESYQQAERELEEARKGVERIDARHLLEIQSYRTPPAIVKLVLSAVMVVLGETSSATTSGWPGIQNVLKSGNFLSRVLSYDPSTITEAQLKQLYTSRYLHHPRFNHKDAVKGSQAIGHLYQWIHSQLALVEVTARTKAFEQEKAGQQYFVEEAETYLQREKEILKRLQKEMQDLSHQYRVAERRQSVSSAAAEVPLRRSASDASDRVTGGQDLHHRWYRPEHSGTPLLVSSVLCDLGPSPPVDSSLVLEPWQKARIEEAIQSHAGLLSCVGSPCSPHTATGSGSAFPRVRRVSQHFITLHGDEWEMVLEDSPEELRLALTNDVAALLEVPNRSVKGVTLTKTPFTVSVAVEHDAALTMEAVRGVLDEGDYPEAMALYGNRHTRRQERETARHERERMERELRLLHEAKQHALEGERAAMEEARAARQALEDREQSPSPRSYPYDPDFQLVGAQTSSQAELLEEIMEGAVFREVSQDALSLREALERKDVQLETAERELAKWEALLKDQEIRTATTEVMLGEMQSALERLRGEKELVEEEKLRREKEAEEERRAAEELREQTDALQDISVAAEMFGENPFLHLLAQICHSRVYVFIMVVLALILIQL